MKSDCDGKRRTMTLNAIKLGTFARNAIRVSAALLAVFFVGGGLSHATPQRGEGVFCASDNGRRNYCGADTRGGVRLWRQRSDPPRCRAGHNPMSAPQYRAHRCADATGGRRRAYRRRNSYAARCPKRKILLRPAEESRGKDRRRQKTQ